jgi:hypothetical protein
LIFPGAFMAHLAREGEKRPQRLEAIEASVVMQASLPPESRDL